jgi:hypothetical protein
LLLLLLLPREHLGSHGLLLLLHVLDELLGGHASLLSLLCDLLLHLLLHLLDGSELVRGWRYAGS